MNLWHDISLGKNAPEEFNAIIEIPKWSYNKYEIDKETGMITLDRANYSSAPYPFDYGFAPKTLWDDNDALDVIVLTTFPLNPGIMARVRPVALLEMTDSGESDNKIIAVPVNDKRWDDTQNLNDINKHSLKEFKHFFENIKTLKGEGDIITVHGYKEKGAAIEAIKKSVRMYNEKFGK